MKSKVKIGIIGGSGLDDPEILENRVEKIIVTPYGEPSDVLIEGKIGGVDCVILARHSRGHSIMPTDVNYRANVWAIKESGCTHLLVSTATGSLRENIQPGDIVIPDNFIDRTTKRHQTFYDGKETSPKGICHLPMEPAFCKRTRDILIQSAQELGIEAHKTGTIVTIEGPRFSSKAESLMFRAWGGDLINMTTVPEVVLAKEIGLCYGAVAMATDYDCWRETGEHHVCVADVLAMFKKNVSKVLQILTTAVKNIADVDWTDTIADLKNVAESSVMAPK